MLFKNSPEKFWDLIAKKYAASPIDDRIAYEKKIQKIKSYLATEDKVLDIGCATGTQCMDIADKVKQVVGVDISAKLLAIAEQRKAERKAENVEFIRTSLFDQRFKTAEFDVVMAFYVLHFFEDIDSVFKRIHELLKPGGLFVCETACLGEKNKIVGKLVRFAGYVGLLPLIKLLTYKKLEEAFEQAGFSLLEKTRFSETGDEYTLIVKKTS